MAKYSSNVYEYLINGDGIHFKSLSKYSRDGSALPVILSTAVTCALQNSIYNSNPNNEFIPISAKSISKDFYGITKRIELGESKEKLMQELDEKLNYNNCRRMSDIELEVLDNIDAICDKLLKLNEYTQKNNEDMSEILETKIKISNKLTILISSLIKERQQDK